MSQQAQHRPADGTIIAVALAWARGRLAAAGADSAALDARLLLCAATGWPAATVIAYPERMLDPEALERFHGLIDRRAAHEPVSRILGQRAFWQHAFSVGPGVLDPRPDSEVLVEHALACLPADFRGLVVDLGVGSGCLLLSVLAERPHMIGLGLDRSADALAIAAQNARNLGLDRQCHFVQGDWASALRSQMADCIISNPPYIASDTIADLAAEVRNYDPRAALDGGSDGLAAYRVLASQLPIVLRDGATAVIEIGHDQAAAVAGLLSAAGMTVQPPHADLGGRDRCLIATPAAG